MLHALVEREFNRTVDSHVEYIESIDPERVSLEEAISGIVELVFESQVKGRPFYRQLLLAALSFRHLRFTLENDTRVLKAVRDKLAAYDGVEREGIELATFVVLYALKGVQLGVVFSERPAGDAKLHALLVRLVLACLTPASRTVDRAVRGPLRGAAGA